MISFHLQHLEKYALKNDEWMSAGKIEKLQDMLPKLKGNGDRVLLFSQFTQVLDILEVVLDTMGIKYLKLTGQTNVTERQGLVDEYTNDPEITVFCEFEWLGWPSCTLNSPRFIVVLSTRAGGLGLNLVAANTVMFVDEPFLCLSPLTSNFVIAFTTKTTTPTTISRPKIARTVSVKFVLSSLRSPVSSSSLIPLIAPQKRDVNIIKFITKGSLEEDMRQLATNKLLLDSEVSSSTQYPSGAAPEEAEGNNAQVEKKYVARRLPLF